MRGKYCSCTLIKILLVYNIKCSLADESKQEDEDKKSIEYFIQDNQLGSQWPHGIVPYYVNLNDYDNLVARQVRSAMNHLEDSSCIKFKQLLEANHFAPWIHISNPNKIRECVHTWENKTSLEIPLVLGYECLQRREILHALMHAIGFKDEVTHPQRDQYVKVLWENINPKYHSLFRVRYDDFAPLKIEYDPNSIMHFHDRAFSKNGQAAVAPKHIKTALRILIDQLCVLQSGSHPFTPWVAIFRSAENQGFKVISLVPGLVINPTAELSPLDKMKLRMIFGHECNKRSVGDLLDSCRMAMRDDTNAPRAINKPHNLTHADTGDESEECTKEDKDSDEPEEHKDLDEPKEDKNYEVPEDQKSFDEPDLKDVDNRNDEEDGKDDNGDQEALKKHRRHHRHNRYRQ